MGKHYIGRRKSKNEEQILPPWSVGRSKSGGEGSSEEGSKGGSKGRNMRMLEFCYCFFEESFYKTGIIIPLHRKY
jgi:hypothetical protein